MRRWSRRAPPLFDDIGRQRVRLEARNREKTGQLLETEPEITGGPVRSDRQGGLGRVVGLAQRQGVGRSKVGVGQLESQRGVGRRPGFGVGQEEPKWSVGNGQGLSVGKLQAERRWLSRDHTHPRARLPAGRAHAASATVEIYAATAFTQTVIMLSPDQTHETVKHPGGSCGGFYRSSSPGPSDQSSRRRSDRADDTSVPTLVGHDVEEDVDTETVSIG